MIGSMVRSVWEKWCSPHALMFLILVWHVLWGGEALTDAMAAGTVSDANVKAFEVLAERATYLAGVIAAAAKAVDLVKAAGDGAGQVAAGLRGAFTATPGESK